MLIIGNTLNIKGMSLGAVMSLLICGTGISVPEIALLSKIYKKPLVIIFIGSMFIVGVTSVFLFNLI